MLPLVVSFIAEQLRIGSADAILAARDYDSAADVGELAPDEQRVVVLSIVRREMGVMTVSCFVVVALALRAATTSGRVLRLPRPDGAPWPTAQTAPRRDLDVDEAGRASLRASVRAVKPVRCAMYSRPPATSDRHARRRCQAA